METSFWEGQQLSVTLAAGAPKRMDGKGIGENKYRQQASEPAHLSAPDDEQTASSSENAEQHRRG